MGSVNRINEDCLTQRELRHLLFYSPEHGLFYRRHSEHGRIAGEVAGNVRDRGYVTITLRKRPYLAHRLAFLYMTGKWPQYNVDHLNRDPSDNRWCNLRDRPQSENVARAMPQGRHIDDRGVSFRAGAWEANIKVDGEAKYLGRFKTKDEALEGYRSACVTAGRAFLFEDEAPPPRGEPAPSVMLSAIAIASPKTPVTPEELRRVFAYNPVTGIITRKVAARGGIYPVGSVVGSIQKIWGYRIVKVRSSGFLAHRVAWAIMTGSWPNHEVDHINGAPDDNRWCNLRAVDASRNMVNRGLFKNNKLGLKGVVPVGNRFLARINVNKKVFRLGRFDTPEEASAAYAEAAARLHGEFARAA